MGSMFYRNVNVKHQVWARTIMLFEMNLNLERIHKRSQHILLISISKEFHSNRDNVVQNKSINQRFNMVSDITRRLDMELTRKNRI
jgi:hypothetical protein